MNNSFLFQGDVIRSLNRYESPEQTDQGSTTLYRLFRYTGQYRFNAMFTSASLRAIYYSSLDCPIHKLPYCAQSHVYLLNIAFINIVVYRNIIIHKRTHTWKFTYVKNTKYAKIQKKTGTYKLQNSQWTHVNSFFF